MNFKKTNIKLQFLCLVIFCLSIFSEPVLSNNLKVHTPTTTQKKYVLFFGDSLFNQSAYQFSAVALEDGGTIVPISTAVGGIGYLFTYLNTPMLPFYDTLFTFAVNPSRLDAVAIHLGTNDRAWIHKALQENQSPDVVLANATNAVTAFLMRFPRSLPIHWVIPHRVIEKCHPGYETAAQITIRAVKKAASKFPNVKILDPENFLKGHYQLCDNTGGNSYIHADNIHPTPEGEKALSRFVYSEVKKTLSKSQEKSHRRNTMHFKHLFGQLNSNLSSTQKTSLGSAVLVFGDQGFKYAVDTLQKRLTGAYIGDGPFTPILQTSDTLGLLTDDSNTDITESAKEISASFNRPIKYVVMALGASDAQKTNFTDHYFIQVGKFMRALPNSVDKVVWIELSKTSAPSLSDSQIEIFNRQIWELQSRYPKMVILKARDIGSDYVNDTNTRNTDQLVDKIFKILWNN